MFALCQLEPDTCCSRMASSLAGLTPEEVAHRLKIYRRNLVAYERRPTLWEEPWGRPGEPPEEAAKGICAPLLPDQEARPTATRWILT